MWPFKKNQPEALHNPVIDQIVEIVTRIGKDVPLGKSFEVPFRLLPEHSSYELKRAAAKLEHLDMKMVNEYGATLDFMREKFSPSF